MSKEQTIKAYPHIEHVVKELSLEPYVDQLEWHYFENINPALANVYRSFKDLTSTSIPARLDAKGRVGSEYLEYSKQLHVFVSEQARNELGLANEDVTKLFKDYELGGTRY